MHHEEGYILSKANIERSGSHIELGKASVAAERLNVKRRVHSPFLAAWLL